MLACGGDKSNNVRFHLVVHVDGLDCFLGVGQVFGRDDLRDVVDGMMVGLRFENGDFVRPIGVAQMRAHDETIDLCFWQGESAFVFDGILGGEHQKGSGHGVGRAIDRDLFLFHRF